LTKRKGIWKDKIYSKQLMAYVDQSIREDEKGIYNAFFNSIVEEYNITRPHDLMLLDVACYDFLRIKRIQSIIMKEGDVTVITLRSGKTLTKAHEASYLLNSVETQFRNNMKELMLTRKEQVKQELGIGSKDFANWLSDKAIDAEYEVKDGEDKGTTGEVREGPEDKTE